MSFPIQLMSVFEDAPLLRGSDERVTARVSTSSSTFRPMFIVGMTILVLCSLEKFGVSDLPDRREAKQTMERAVASRRAILAAKAELSAKKLAKEQESALQHLMSGAAQRPAAPDACLRPAAPDVWRDAAPQPAAPDVRRCPAACST